MSFLTKNLPGICVCLAIAIPCQILGNLFPVIGGAVFAILTGMIVTLFLHDKSRLQSGITFVSKKILQYAVILLGFGLNLSVVLETGKQSLPIILVTISVSLLIAYILHHALHIPGNISTLIGVGSSICGGSAIAATAPVIDARWTQKSHRRFLLSFSSMLPLLYFPGAWKCTRLRHNKRKCFRCLCRNCDQ